MKLVMTKIAAKAVKTTAQTPVITVVKYNTPIIAAINILMTRSPVPIFAFITIDFWSKLGTLTQLLGDLCYLGI